MCTRVSRNPNKSLNFYNMRNQFKMDIWKIKHLNHCVQCKYITNALLVKILMVLYTTKLCFLNTVEPLLFHSLLSKFLIIQPPTPLSQLHVNLLF